MVHLILGWNSDQRHRALSPVHSRQERRDPIAFDDLDDPLADREAAESAHFVLGDASSFHQVANDLRAALRVSVAINI